MGITRTIIIVWSWKAAGTGEGVWEVAGSGNTKDVVVCYDWPASPDGDTQQLAALIRQYAQQEGEVMLFLHRHHGYYPEHLKQLISQVAEDQQERFRCFLFGEGSDAIYLTNDPRGLLGTSGTFSAQITTGEHSLEVSSIADAERRLLKSAHFDYIWDTYQHALRRRIFELKEDMFNYLGQYLPQLTFPPGELYTLLTRPENKLLLLRLLSFVGRIRKGSEIAKEIRTFERNNNRALTFDDCGIQLETSYGAPAAEQYALLAAYVLRNVLAKGNPVSLPELRERFDDLLVQISGLTYHS
ncbi:hypothetical protein [Lewinella sp. LCG006]|uniref:hypothetical protein n=1 Tax=Lewinella sp. LCG006 TaxID=3231911 RepID=UPI0034614F02